MWADNMQKKLNLFGSSAFIMEDNAIIELSADTSKIKSQNIIKYTNIKLYTPNINGKKYDYLLFAFDDKKGKIYYCGKVNNLLSYWIKNLTH